MSKKSAKIDQIWTKLEEVLDPEMYISIVDLGLVYNVKIDSSTAHITMTLTSLGCPLFSVIEKDISNRVQELPHITSVKIELTFDPPWSVDRMSEKGKAILGI